MSRPALLAVAHGSRHPAAAEAVSALARQVRRLAPVLDIRVTYLRHAEPSLADAIAAAGSGSVAVPLLLSPGYHLSYDIAIAACGAEIAVADPLGPDLLLVTALAGRLAGAGVPAGTPVVLAAAGSAEPLAGAAVAAQARLLADHLGSPVLAAFAAAGQPSVSDAVSELRARTAGPVAVASYLIAPGEFHDRLGHSGADWVTAPLGDHPALAGLIIDRYRQAVAARRPALRSRQASHQPANPSR